MYANIKKKKTITPEHQKRIDEFKPIELILLLGEPVNWECSLQVKNAAIRKYISIFLTI